MHGDPGESWAPCGRAQEMEPRAGVTRGAVQPHRAPPPGPVQRRRPCSPAGRAMASLRAERAGGSPWLPAIRAGRPAALRLLLLLGAVLKSQESLAQLLPTPGSMASEGKTVEEIYEANVQFCWEEYKIKMDSIKKDWCDWAMISRPYSNLQYCLEQYAEMFDLGFPNPWAEQIIFETHQIHFANCSLVQPTFSDPPEDVLLAMIIAPICLIPFLVTLVVWRSKDNEAQA
ncbi:hypothetical protein MC885_012835 [Smutsia gigantea]|nr:hypothetical protein MC885_012835 [Smutsia gigantea]